MATIANFQPQARLADPHQEGLPNYAYLAGLLAMLVGIGMYMFYRQTAQGLGITGLNRPVQWGIYVANFIFCVGLSAGGIAISAMAHTLNLEKLKTIAVVAEAMAISFLILAGIFITLDLGRPDRIYFLLLYARLTSPLLWDVIVINSYLVLCSALLFFSVRPEMAEKFGSSRKTRWLARLFSLGVPLPFSHGALEVNHKVLRILAIVFGDCLDPGFGQRTGGLEYHDPGSSVHCFRPCGRNGRGYSQCFAGPLDVQDQDRRQRGDPAWQVPLPSDSGPYVLSVQRVFNSGIFRHRIPRGGPRGTAQGSFFGDLLV